MRKGRTSGPRTVRGGDRGDSLAPTDRFRTFWEYRRPWAVAYALGTLGAALRLLDVAWKCKKEALNAGLILGTARFFSSRTDCLTTDEIARFGASLRPANPTTLIAEAERRYRQSRGGIDGHGDRRSWAVSEVLTELYVQLLRDLAA